MCQTLITWGKATTTWVYVWMISSRQPSSYFTFPFCHQIRDMTWSHWESDYMVQDVLPLHLGFQHHHEKSEWLSRYPSLEYTELLCVNPAPPWTCPSLSHAYTNFQLDLIRAITLDTQQSLLCHQNSDPVCPLDSVASRHSHRSQVPISNMRVTRSGTVTSLPNIGTR